MLRRRNLLVTCVLLAPFTACSDSAQAPPPVASVSVSAPGSSLTVGQTMTLTASARDAQGNVLSGRTIEWQSTNAAVAQVSGSGVVTALDAGPVAIVARSEGRTGQTSLTVLPVPVAAVQITAQGSTSLLPGQTLQLEAVTYDAGGGELSGRPVAWSSSDTTRARVSGTGIVTAWSPGDATITATSEGITGTIAVAVAVHVDAPIVLSTTPAQLVPGAVATVYGQNFDAAPAGNAVSVRGVAAPVLSASPTQLTIRVPCVTPGTVALQVRSNGLAGEPFAAPLAVAARAVGLGEALIVDSAESECNQIPAAAETARYLVVVYSDATVSSALLDFRLSGNTPGAGAAVPQLVAASRAVRAPRQRDAASVHDSIHFVILERERALYEQLRAEAARMPPALQGAAQQAALPVPGQMRNLYYNFGGCADTTAVIRGRAVYIGTHSIIWEDSANALQSAAHPQLAAAYERVGNIFDLDQYRIVRDNFGDPLRRDPQTDNDGRIHMVFTQRLNGSGAAAYVTSCDQYPRTVRPASNFGEFFYGFVPTSTDANPGSTATIEGWLPFMSRTVVHEVKHIASMAARVANNASFEHGWLEEGTARHAEELWVRSDLHRVPWKGGSSYGTAADNGVFCDFNLASATCNGHDALRRPSWGMRRHFNEIHDKLHEPWDWSPYGSGPGQQGSVFYQTAWSLVRYIVDRYATTEAAFFTALTSSTLTGSANLSAAAGAPMDRMIGLWGAALYADNYAAATPHADLRFPTWNLRGIYGGLNADPLWTNRWNAPFPIAPLLLPAGAFDTHRDGLRGGAHAYFEIVVPAGELQLLHLRATDGGPASANARMLLTRLQ